VTELDAYLRDLEMRLVWSNFDEPKIQRIVQLIARWNQFNLMPMRYSQEDVRSIIGNPGGFGLHLRLVDRFGSSGVIAIVIGRLCDNADLEIDAWLMSCRALGRQVEPTTLNLIAERAKEIGARRILGKYIPTKKNGLVKDHYARLGFRTLHADDETGSRNVLDLASFKPIETFIRVTSA
jgi:FkbH-like protein